MMSREVSGRAVRGGILADEMGLGKTIQMAGLIRSNVSKPHEANLLIAPVAVLEQWKTVIRKCGLTVYVPGEGKATWQIEGAQAKGALAPFVCVTSYEMMARYPHLTQMTKWHRCILDEAHRTTGGGAVFVAAKKIQAERRWLLTATPIVNALRDLKRLFELLGLENVDLPEDRALFAEYILARSMDQLRQSIPDAPPAPVEHTVSLPFATQAEADYYRGKLTVLTRRWEAIAGNNGADAALERLRLFMRLRQLSLHPQIYIATRNQALRGFGSLPDWQGSSTKFEALRRLVRAEPGRRWIIFCHFKTEMEMLRALFESEECVERVGVYNGVMTATKKAEVIEHTHQPLEAGRSEVLLVQLQSGGTGLNLQHFNRIVFTGPWWAKATMDQAVGRAVRIGQRDAVQIYHLILKEEEQLNIDAFMKEKADAKGELCRKALEYATRNVV